MRSCAEELPVDISGWQKEIIDTRLSEYQNDPGNTLDWDKVFEELTKPAGL